jgi:hypothetical protein
LFIRGGLSGAGIYDLPLLDTERAARFAIPDKQSLAGFQTRGT